MTVWHIPAKLEELSPLTERITQLLEKWGCPSKAIVQIIIAAEEIFANCARYAYPHGEGEVLIRCGTEHENGRRVVRLEFEDRGIPYNPLENKDPDITLSAEERQIGGLGIMMTKKMMDAAEYQYDDGYNKLYLKKYI